MLMIFPLLSISFNIWNIGILFANVATIPAAATSFIPKTFPNFINGLLNTFVITATKQNAPAKVNAMLPTTSIPSVTGAMSGMTVIPTSN